MRFACAGLVLLCLLATGCSTYELQGKVVEGPVSGVMIVDRGDPRLHQPGLGGAMLDLTLDPGRMSEKRLGAQHTDLDGNFAVPIREPGAGLLEYDVEVLGQMRGFESAIHKMRLPSKNKRVLVVLREGRDSYRPQRDIIEESLRIGGEQSQ